MKYNFITTALVGAILVVPISATPLPTLSKITSIPEHTGLANTAATQDAPTSNLTPVATSDDIFQTIEHPQISNNAPVSNSTTIEVTPTSDGVVSAPGTTPKHGRKYPGFFPHFGHGFGHGPVVPGRGFHPHVPSNITSIPHQLQPSDGSCHFKDSVLDFTEREYAIRFTADEMAAWENADQMRKMEIMQHKMEIADRQAHVANTVRRPSRNNHDCNISPLHRGCDLESYYLEHGSYPKYHWHHLNRPVPRQVTEEVPTHTHWQHLNEPSPKQTTADVNTTAKALENNTTDIDIPSPASATKPLADDQKHYDQSAEYMEDYLRHELTQAGENVAEYIRRVKHFETDLKDAEQDIARTTELTHGPDGDRPVGPGELLFIHHAESRKHVAEENLRETQAKLVEFEIKLMEQVKRYVENKKKNQKKGGMTPNFADLF